MTFLVMTYAELDVDGEVCEIGANLLLDGLSTGIGTEVDVGLNGSDLLASESSLQDEISEFGSG
jgi:hypothetical protein